MERFKSNGSESVGGGRPRVDISRFRLAERCVDMDRGDLEHTVLKLVLQKSTSVL
jgi:hypothetical protein